MVGLLRWRRWCSRRPAGFQGSLFCLPPPPPHPSTLTPPPPPSIQATGGVLASFLGKPAAVFQLWFCSELWTGAQDRHVSVLPGVVRGWLSGAATRLGQSGRAPESGVCDLNKEVEHKLSLCMSCALSLRLRGIAIVTLISDFRG